MLAQARRPGIERPVLGLWHRSSPESHLLQSSQRSQAVVPAQQPSAMR
jgi:hypothetical protein